MSLLVGCATTGPSEAEIYYAAALRPSVELATTAGERALLAHLGELPTGPTAFEGESFEVGVTYASGSGRTCRRVRTARAERLACDGRDAESPTWSFVPDPFRPSSGDDVPVVPASYDGTAPTEGP